MEALLVGHGSHQKLYIVFDMMIENEQLLLANMTLYAPDGLQVKLSPIHQPMRCCKYKHNVLFSISPTLSSIVAVLPLCHFQ